MPGHVVPAVVEGDVASGRNEQCMVRASVKTCKEAVVDGWSKRVPSVTIGFRQLTHRGRLDAESNRRSLTVEALDRDPKDAVHTQNLTGW